MLRSYAFCCSSYSMRRSVNYWSMCLAGVIDCSRMLPLSEDWPDIVSELNTAECLFSSDVDGSTTLTLSLNRTDFYIYSIWCDFLQNGRSKVKKKIYLTRYSLACGCAAALLCRLMRLFVQRRRHLIDCLHARRGTGRLALL